MANDPNLRLPDADEMQDWLDALDDVLRRSGSSQVRALLDMLQTHAISRGVDPPASLNTPYINSIPRDKQPPYPGSHELERQLRNILRWNAIIMVVRANLRDPTIGGHIATYASTATLFEVAFNHFLRGRTSDFVGDQVFFQPHAAPGVYARAFLEGRLSESQLVNYRRELSSEGGLSSYPHPWLMPDFWQFPSASMGLSPIMAIYQARFNRYLEDRGLIPASDARVWAFIGDGETDEPESLGAISLAAREKLDNLIFVVNCNLQRLDGPVRGNGKIIQELETFFRGAGWNVIKVIWGSDWDPLIAQDHEGLLARRMGELVDGQYQKYSVSSGAWQRQHFFGTDPRLIEMSRMLTDEQIRGIRRGGHDPDKVYAAYNAATQNSGAPSIVLAKTIKGYGMGEVGEGRMTAHQLKKLDLQTLQQIRTRFGIPVSDEEVADLPFYRPPEDSPVMQYMFDRRRALGGFVPRRVVEPADVSMPSADLMDEFLYESDSHAASTTKVFVRILTKLLRDTNFGARIVPIVADEARTFGMESLFRPHGIYSHIGQLYEPVDAEHVASYREARDGQLIEEGITEAGAMSTFIAAGTSYATHSLPMVPFFIFYSMFGFQRVGDLIYAAGDARARGFLIGATSGRTTLNGEGLQHQDGHSHVQALTCPHVTAYDIAFGYELAVIIRDGIRRMLIEQEDVIYYLTVQNEPVEMSNMPEGVETGILRGMYRLRQSSLPRDQPRAVLLGSGSIVHEALRAGRLLEEQFGVAADVWSVTSFPQMYREAIETDRRNMLHPELPPNRHWISECLTETHVSYILASDFQRVLPNMIAGWFPVMPVSLGTDGFGRSESRAALRRYFEIDAAAIAYAALADLSRRGQIPMEKALAARQELKIEPDRVSAMFT
ncbi:MAG: pyruvate dehydrogenase (acetyl-transferring), homodimeric type [Planctomycetaceae bacterium]|nr:pyruvate dehydrogenase (acetyl-transferring), homodimeric type [Planctomycetaceae bacterium]